MTLRRWVIAGLIVAAALMVWTSPVWAHSFLVDTQPSQGERLTRSPSEVVFQFTEAVVTDRVEIAVNTADETNVDTGSPEAESDGRVVRVPLLQPVDGVAVVSWHVVSAVDGHESAGETAFAVREAGSLPTATSSAAAGVGGQGRRWLFLAGLSLGVGALVASATGQTTRSGWAGPARLGLIVAALSPTAVYVTSTPRDLSVATLSLGAAAVFLSIAALTTAATRRTWPLIFTGLGIVAWSARSHTATIRGVLGMAADAAHLAGAVLWLGTLGVLVVALWRARRARGSLLDSAASTRGGHCGE